MSGISSAAARWHQLTEWPLMGAAVAFFVCYATQVLAEPTGTTAGLIEVVTVVTWIVFVIDYLVRLSLADRRGQWFVRHLLDLAVVALPLLRPLRMLRLLTLMSVLHRVAGSTLRGRVMVYVIGATAMLVLVSSLAMLDAERHVDGSTIRSFADATWWSIVTITTVGYGDTHPVTGSGRVIAAALVIGGVALLGIVTATLASWLVQKVAEQDEASAAATTQQVRELTEEVRELRALLERSVAVARPQGLSDPETARR